jgi:hypothetical protein
MITAVNIRGKPSTPIRNLTMLGTFRKPKWLKYKEELDFKMSNKGKTLKYDHFESDLLKQLTSEREKAKKKAVLSKDLKDVQTWRENLAIVKKGDCFIYDTSEVCRFISALKNKHSINHSALIHSENSTTHLKVER